MQGATVARSNVGRTTDSVELAPLRRPQRPRRVGQVAMGANHHSLALRETPGSVVESSVRTREMRRTKSPESGEDPRAYGGIHEIGRT
jgi:hypothetical protein